jgi:hypothetical protein
MNGMKKLLSVVAILVLAGSLLPGTGQAGVRGAFDFITNGDALVRGHYSPAYRHVPNTGGNSGSPTSVRTERWLSVVTTSSIVGSENVGEIWQVRVIDQAVARGLPPTPILRDELSVVSYVDPAWSFDGKWLAYVVTDNFITKSSIWVQQYTVSNTDATARIPLGSPILIADGSAGFRHRRPAWNPAGTQIAYDSDASGTSIDLWTVDVTLDDIAHTGSTGTRTQVTFFDSKGEMNCKYSPDGTKLAFVTNLYGPFTVQILNLVTESGGSPTARFNGPAGTINGAEVNPALVTHDNPSWSSNGLTLYYDAPSSEDAANPQDVWKLDLVDGAKCPISTGLTGDVDPDVSHLTNFTAAADGAIPFNYFLFIGQAGGFGVQVWRGQFVKNCVAPLPMNITISPASINLGNNDPGCDPDSLPNCGGAGSGAQGTVEISMSFPAVTMSHGFVCRAANGNAAIGGYSGEGVRLRRATVPSPVMDGIVMRSTPNHGDCSGMDQFGAVFGFSPYYESYQHMSCSDALNLVYGNVGDWNCLNIEDFDKTNDIVQGRWNRRSLAARLTALGLVNEQVPLRVDAYSNRVGRAFLGYGYINVATGNTSGSIVRLQQNYPNPFNPQTAISFATSKPGVVDVRVFNARGQLVRTITNQWYPQGEHTVAWDGKADNGHRSSSAVYFVRARMQGGGSDVIKAVLAQ